METVNMFHLRVIGVILLLVIAPLTSDGHQSHGNEEASTTHQKYDKASFFEIDSGSKHPFSALPIDGEPDSVIENRSGRKVIRKRSGNLGYLSLATPQWFRPIFMPGRPNEYSRFIGSLIILTSEAILVDFLVANLTIPNDFFSRLERGKRYEFYTMFHRDDEIQDKWLYYDFKPNHNLHLLEVELIEILDSGFCLFKLIDPYVRFPDRWLIRWRVNYNRDGYKRYGYPEDVFRRPDLGCFGFMYTKALLDYESIVVNTEYPVHIVQYDENDRTLVYANNGRYNYQPYSLLVKRFNSGSPVFCGPEGRLRFFARQFNETTLKLIPIHDIANDIRIPAGFTYEKFVTMLDRRDRDHNEPGWEEHNLPPWWFRQMYREKQIKIRGRTSWYGGYMIVLSPGHFMVPETVTKVALKNESLEWTHFNYDDPMYPTKRVNSFGEPPGIRRDSESYPKFDRALGYSGMHLYERRTDDPGWRRRGFPRIEMGRDHSESNCNYLTHMMIGNSSEPDIRLATRMPAFVIPNSCSDWHCYIQIPTINDSSMFQPFNPVICEGYPAFIMLDDFKQRPADEGRLGLKIEVILLELRRTHYALYRSIVKNPDQRIPVSSYYYPEFFEDPLLFPDKVPSWYSAMLHNSPNRGHLFDYAGPRVIVSKDKFLAADYVINNALLPRQYTHNHIRFPDLPEENKVWIYGNGLNKPPLEWDPYESISQDLIEGSEYSYPELDHHLEDVNMVLMTLEAGFGEVDLPNFRDFDPRYNSLSSLKNCYAYTYTYDDNKRKLVFTGIPINIKRCDDTYCYGPQNPFNWRYELSSGLVAGAPIVCESDCGLVAGATRVCESNLMFYNAPFPDHLNHAEFRIIRQAVIGKMLEESKLYTNLKPPNWYRLLLFDEFPPPLHKPITFLPQMIVINKYLFLGLEKDIEVALELSRKTNRSWTLLMNNKQPTPSAFFELNPEMKRNEDDIPFRLLALRNTGLAIYQRSLKYEEVEEGSIDFLSKQINNGKELLDDCWVYIYKREPDWNKNQTYKFYIAKVTIRYCENGICDTRPHRGLFQEGAPIVCKGVLSYVYHRKESHNTPAAVQISWIHDVWNAAVNWTAPLPDEQSTFEKFTSFFEMLIKQAVKHRIIVPNLVKVRD